MRNVDRSIWWRFRTEFVSERFQNRRVVLIDGEDEHSPLFKEGRPVLTFSDDWGYENCAILWESCPRDALVRICESWQFDVLTLIVSSPSGFSVKHLQAITTLVGKVFQAIHLDLEQLDQVETESAEEALFCMNDGYDLIYINPSVSLQECEFRAGTLAAELGLAVISGSL
jgi:hypothetical protein